MQLKRLNPGIARYVVAGALSYAIELTALLTFHKAMGLSAAAATAIAFWIGLIASFFFQKIFAFKDYQKAMKAITHQLVAYGILVMFNYLFTLAVVSVFPAKDIVFSRTFALIIVTAWNYYLYKRFIFRKEPYEISPRRIVAYIKENRRRIVFVCLVTIPILLFFYQYIGTGNKMYGGDFDYYSQLYEAFRISVLKFHQFPLWNPWMSGGMPLFFNPQFGLFSLQSLLVLVFGSIYGLKLAFVIYALLGFWGMYFVGKRALGASTLRSVLVGYIWVFSGFFASHGIWHFTFTSYFLVPWVVYLIYRRNQPRSWLWLGVIFSLIILSSIHYAVLMMMLVMPIFLLVSLSRLRISRSGLKLSLNLTSQDLRFIAKTVLVIIILAGYQFILTYHFVSNNQRITNSLEEIPPSVGVLFRALFLPISTIIHHAPKTSWPWGEYSMYIGMGAGIALFVCLMTIFYSAAVRNRRFFDGAIGSLGFVVPVLVIGLLSFLLALGDIGKFSPFHLLHSLPGFTQTRVPSRWQIFTMFSVLVFLAAWRRYNKLINILLIASVVELFITFGPTRLSHSWYVLPPAKFASSFSQYDNHHHHFGVAKVTVADPNNKSLDTNVMDSYYQTTAMNIGQIYADDSLIDTMSGPTLLQTARCAQNDQASCNFVLTDNAQIVSWSPNKIILTRTGPGTIELNMNVEAGWQINGVYPYANIKSLQPSIPFILPAGQANYTLEYAPKLSPAWIIWKLHRL